MADLNTGNNGSSLPGKHNKKRAKRMSTRIDMTPMVDLAFLLLTFFVLTATFVRPSVMEINMPVKSNDSTKVKNLLTLILDKSDTVRYYYGELRPNAEHPFMITDYSNKGVRKVLIEYNREEFDKVTALEKKLLLDKALDPVSRKAAFEKGSAEITGAPGTLTVAVKTCDDAKYERVIDIMDELNVTYITRKAILDVSEQERELLDKER
jgi:biopolymer transport protein ExbD